MFISAVFHATVSLFPLLRLSTIVNTSPRHPSDDLRALNCQMMLTASARLLPGPSRFAVSSSLSGERCPPHYTKQTVDDRAINNSTYTALLIMPYGECVQCRAQWLRGRAADSLDYENPGSNPGCGSKNLGQVFSPYIAPVYSAE